MCFAQSKLSCVFIVIASLAVSVSAQTAAKGSQTAKAGFNNEAEIAAMVFLTSGVESVSAARPHGKKSDVEVTVKIGGTTTVNGREPAAAKLLVFQRGKR